MKKVLAGASKYGLEIIPPPATSSQVQINITTSDRSLTLNKSLTYQNISSHIRVRCLLETKIRDKVWGYDFISNSNIIQVYIGYLRLKLKDNKEKRVINIVRGVGYALRDKS